MISDGKGLEIKLYKEKLKKLDMFGLQKIQLRAEDSNIQIPSAEEKRTF